MRDAFEVCRVDRTRCPVSAAVIASEIVSKSRISPTMITSGSSRSAARSAVANELRGLRYELDFPAKFRRSFRKQTGSWISAAAAVGAVIALVPMRKKKVDVDARTRHKRDKKLVQTGLAMAAMKLVGNLARPVIMEFVKNRFFYSGEPSRGRK